MKGTTLYLENIPNVPGSCISRIEALKAARPLLSTTEFLKSSGPGALDLIRLATYIETGHDYLDTHVEGKRRPITKITNVTVVAPPTVDTEDIEHFLHHVENGDFAEFIKDMVKEQGEAGEKEDGDPAAEAGPEDEEAGKWTAPPFDGAPAQRFGWNL